MPTVDAVSELSQFLTSRQAKVTPEQAGLPTYGQRRVPGLRREEVASLAGVSVEYYKRLERGNATGASDQVLEALPTRCASTTPSVRISSTSPAPPGGRDRFPHNAGGGRPEVAARPAGRTPHPRQHHRASGR